MQGRKPRGIDCPYDVTEFAAKHGLAEKSAQTILLINGSSKEHCDAAAAAFKEAVAQRQAKRLADRLSVD